LVEAEQSRSPGHLKPETRRKLKTEDEFPKNQKLKRLNVRRLPALGSLDNVELHSLTFLKALETVRIDRRVVNKHVLAVLTADEAKPLGIVKPLHCSLFHVVSFLITDEFAARSKSGIEIIQASFKPI
jgi:hypothetical protein